MKKYFVCSVIYFLLTVPSAYAQDTTEDAEFQKFLQEQQQGVDNLMKEYDDYERQQQAEFAAYVREVEQKWRDFQGSTKKEWVDYSPDKESKSYVNFEEGKVEVEALVPANDPKAKEKAENKLLEKVQSLISKDNPTKDNVLDKQLVDSKGNPVTEKNIKIFTSELISKKSIVRMSPIKGKDGIERVRFAVTLQLVPDHIKRRANRYLEQIRHFTKQFQMDPRLVFAIMHTESYFNPLAKSPVPAFGLMQLVPKSGGKDAYAFVHNESKLVTADYLYIPRNNIELGVAYLKLLKDKYFKGIDEPEKIIYIITCAYNTGAGNVCRALTGTKNLQKGIQSINKLSSKELYNKLLASLPYDETRNYLKNVVSRMGLYEEWKQ
jgi:membrane-bound lytic murein transglycosylase C